MKMQKLLLIFVFLLLSPLGMAQEKAESSLPEKLAQEQLDAYNARDIEAFLKPYSKDVEVYTFPNQLNYKGLDKMRERYGKMFANTPDLHCELVKRMVMGNTVIDQEKVTGFPGRDFLEAIAIYKIEDGKIAKVYFVPR